ncbi:MAG TPA: hypothetical protein VFS43_05025 [Polyangiaceae bacterium]|nr:hypothetical protein [Polyangiaceae bacterium]
MSEEAEQCSTSDDCRGLGGAFADSTCDASGRCVLPTGTGGSGGAGGSGGGVSGSGGGGAGGGPAVACTKNSDCIGSFGLSLCREQKCAPLVSEDCPKAYGVPSDDDAQNTLVGFLTPLSQGTQSFLGDGMARTFALARGEYEKAVATLSATPAAPVVVVCDEVADPVRATRHLVVDLGAKLVVGPAFDRSLTAVSEETRAAGALLVSPTADGIALNEAPLKRPDDALWSCRRNRSRVLPYYQAAVDRALAVFGAQRPALFETARAVMIAADEPSTARFADEIEKVLVLNGALAKGSANYKRINHAWSLVQPTDFEGLGALVKAEAEGALKPNLVIFPSSVDRVEAIITEIEQQWPAGVERPAYLLDEPIEGMAGLAVSFTSLRPRVLGVRPHRDARSRAAYQAFLAAYAQEFGGNSRPLFRAEYAYDAFFASMYALSAAGRDAGRIRIAPSGEAMRRGVGFLNGPGTQVSVGRTGVAPFFATLLTSGTPVELAGASGPLTFDDPTRIDPDADGELYCVGETNGYCSMGIVFDSATGAVSTADPECPCGGPVQAL